MSVKVFYRVECDACGASWTAYTAWEARDMARAAGWTCGKRLASKDLCPDHLTAPPAAREAQR